MAGSLIGIDPFDQPDVEAAKVLAHDLTDRYDTTATLTDQKPFFDDEGLALPMATERARQLGLRGAAFPWRTIHGEECSSYWPAGTAAFHVNADIATHRHARAVRPHLPTRNR